jgi:PKD repeat protein
MVTLYDEVNRQRRHDKKAFRIHRSIGLAPGDGRSGAGVGRHDRMDGHRLEQPGHALHGHGFFGVCHSPPYNTIQAQVVDASGNLVTSASGVTVTYQAVADPTGSINTTSVGKDNFWTFAASLFGLAKPLAPDVGLTGLAMPGMMNKPQPMTFDPANNWFIAEGIPITPYDDAGRKNTYPMMRLVAKDSGGNVLATTDIVLPISDEMDCKACHSSNSSAAARPNAGWVNDLDADRDYRLNVLRLHDDRQGGSASYATALSKAGYSSTGLYDTVTTAGKPILCATCHGSTHAEFPSSHPNDNIQSIELQGHKGMLVDCTTCHGSQSLTIGGGPHGMHPVGQSWVGSHGDAADDGRAAQCQACHGTDYRGTVLSRAQGNRTISAFGSKLFWKGFQVGCYTCHNGPGGGDSGTANPPATVANASAATTAGAPVTLPLSATDPHGNQLTLRVVSQPANGTAGLTGIQATYYPDSSFSGTDTFTFAAWNGSTDSNLGTVAVTVGGGAACTVTAQATVPSTGTVGQSLAVQGSATSQGCSNPVSYAWTFGDGSSSTQQTPTHTYAAANTYTWRLTASVGGSSNSVTGTIAVASAPACSLFITGTVPTSAYVGQSVSFPLTVKASGCSGSISYRWNFGDGTDGSTKAQPTHTYRSSGTYSWQLRASIGSTSAGATGKIAVSY